MPAKLCIALALALLLGALATGNPFLRPRPGTAPVPVVTPVSLRAVPSTAVELPPCPVAALQALVVEVRFAADGSPRWLLRDGRELGGDLEPVTSAAGH